MFNEETKKIMFNVWLHTTMTYLWSNEYVLVSKKMYQSQNKDLL